MVITDGALPLNERNGSRTEPDDDPERLDVLFADLCIVVHIVARRRARLSGVVDIVGNFRIEVRLVVRLDVRNDLFHFLGTQKRALHALAVEHTLRAEKHIAVAEKFLRARFVDDRAGVHFLNNA